MRIRPVLLNPADDNVQLLRLQELPVSLRVLGEVDHETPAKQGDYYGEDALPDKDPAPAAQTTDAVHLLQPVRY